MTRHTALGVALAAGLTAGVANAQLFTLTDPSGLAAEVEFTLVDPTTIDIRIRNISTGVPGGFEAADGLLTTVSWDFGMPGDNAGEPLITGGSARTGDTSASVNFDFMDVGANADIGGEWGYGNGGQSETIQNFVSGNSAGATAFGGANLDGSHNLNGPQAGLVADDGMGGPLTNLGGLGAILDEVVVTITLDQPIDTLSFLNDNGVRVEFGSDAALLDIPAPATAIALACVGAGHARRRRWRR